jgi:hypothetical protein
LIIGLGADDAAAQAVFPRFSAAAVKATADASQGMAGLTASANASATAVQAFGERTESSLLSSRESTRLLSEELGVHLPRAVSSAISKMLPDIAMLGTAFLGVFAIEKVYGWAEAGADKIREMYTAVDQDIKDLDAAAAAAFKHAGAEASEMLTHFKTSLAGAFDIAEIDARAHQLERYHNAYKLLMDKADGDVRVLGTISSEAVATIAEAAKQGIYDLATVDQKVAETGQLQFEARKHQAEVIAEEHKKGSKAVKETADRLVELLAKERDQAQALDIGVSKERQLFKAYNDEVRAIDAAAAAAGKKGLSDKQEAEATEAKAQALRNYHTALAQLAPVFPPIVEEMTKIEESLFAEKIHQQALAILGLDDAAKKVRLSLPDYAAMLKLESGALTQVTGATHQLTAAQRAALPTDQEIKKVNEDLLKIWPNMTEQERKLMAAHLATAAAVHKATTETGNRALVTRDLTKAILEELVVEGKLTEAEAKSMATANGVVLGAKRAGASLQDLKQDFLGVADATAAAGIAAAIYGKNVGQAMEQAAKATLASIAEQAGVSALNALAQGLWFLAQAIFFGDPDAAAAAATDFEAAAAWGAIGGVAGAAAAAIPGGGGGGASATASAAGAGRYGTGGPAGAANQPMGPTARGALPAQVGQGPGITSFGGGGGGPSVSIHNDFSNATIYGGPSGLQELSKKIAAPMAAALSNYTQRQGGNLVARVAILPPKAGR